MSVSAFNRRWAAVILEALTRHGVRHVCIAPGSRSTPLTLAAAENSAFIHHTHFDERGLGHLALGVVYPLRTFFVSVGRGKLAMLSGTGEFIGNAFCAAVLIPRCGALGRSLSYPLGWLAAAVFLLAAYWSAGRRCAKIGTRAN